MRADQPVRLAASHTWSPSIAAKVNRSVSRPLRLARPRPAVGVLEPHDVVRVRRRDLEDRRVLERRDAVDGTGRVVEAVPGPDQPGVEGTLSRGAELELRPAALDVPALLLLAVELEAERVAGADEEGLAEIRIRVGPDQLPPPGLLDLARLDRPGVEAPEVRRVDAHARSRRRQSRRLRSLMISVEPTL